MRRLRSESSVSTSSAARLPSIARFSRASSTGSRDCASSRVKVFMGLKSFLEDTPKSVSRRTMISSQSSAWAAVLRSSSRPVRLMISCLRPHDRRAQKGMTMTRLLRIAPELPALSLKSALDFYEHKLGFRVATQAPGGAYAIVERDGVAIHLFP